MNRRISKILVPLILTTVLLVPLLIQPAVVKAKPDAGDVWSNTETITPVLNYGYLSEKTLF